MLISMYLSMYIGLLISPICFIIGLIWGLLSSGKYKHLGLTLNSLSLVVYTFTRFIDFPEDLLTK